MSIVKMNEESKKKVAMGTVLICILPAIAVGIASIILLNLVQDQIVSVTVATVIIVIAALALGGFTVYFIKGLIEKIHFVMQKFGHLTDETVVDFSENKMLQRKDELGEIVRSVNKTIVSFAHIVNSIKKATSELKDVTEEFNHSFENMTTSMNQVSNEVDSITDNTLSQKRKTEDIAQKIKAISLAIDKIGVNVNELTQSANMMRECNGNAEGIMKELVAISVENSQAIEEVMKQTDVTNESALQIRTATEIIAGISSQTNLLALNASIEAARAGENGKGFAVVAEEIRTLADQSRESSEQINKIVNALIENSNVSVDITQKVSAAFEEQNEKIKDTETIFDSLNMEIENVSSSIIEIGGEVKGLHEHKEVMEEGITVLIDTAEKNNASSVETLNAMNEFETIVADCRVTTEKITTVTGDLVNNITKISNGGFLK